MISFISLLASPLLYLLAFQIRLPELRLLSGKYNYAIQRAQFVTFGSFFLCLLIVATELVVNCRLWLFELILLISSLLFAFFFEWFLSRFSPKNAFVCWLLRLVFAMSVGLCETLVAGTFLCAPIMLIGLYTRNSPFGMPFGKTLSLACLFSRVMPEFQYDDNLDELMCFAGKKHFADEPSEVYVVTDYGIRPDTTTDLTGAFQTLIDKVGQAGGGRIFFPKGRYLFCKNGEYIRINHSHVWLEGEIDADGMPLAELVCCSTTVKGHKNPWLSPFFITTGEQLQPSNEFFGVQFKNKQDTILHSGSLSDPGSDGSLLQPEYATKLTCAAQRGDDVIYVEDSRLPKYIMIALYNTTPDGNLIKEILGVDALGDEWTTARRAGDEQAPSYQWLVEVEEIIDSHRVRLARPLLRDLPMNYEPTVFGVEMLEDVSIRNLRINSLWNGMFRHHGFPLYYSVRQSQVMDYGWNAINMKRVAHGEVSNVQIMNFTNPLYVLDSRNITVKDLLIDGHDGHQGIKLYQHACDNLFQRVRFLCNYADMMGGEGNAYGNVFADIVYANPLFNPVDFDFHGFGEGPMSPPSDNLFVRVRGFRYIKSAAARHMLPGAAQRNRWYHLSTEGERQGDVLFLDLACKPKKGLLKFVTAVGYSIVMIRKNREYSFAKFVSTIRRKLVDIDRVAISPRRHYELFVGTEIRDVTTTADLSGIDSRVVKIVNSK